ncbi:hypothetical protein P9112_009624 [Eukaryota sp. TZLM1-RC]
MHITLPSDQDGLFTEQSDSSLFTVQQSTSFSYFSNLKFDSSTPNLLFLFSDNDPANLKTPHVLQSFLSTHESSFNISLLSVTSSTIHDPFQPLSSHTITYDPHACFDINPKPSKFTHTRDSCEDFLEGFTELLENTIRTTVFQCLISLITFNNSKLFIFEFPIINLFYNLDNEDEFELLKSFLVLFKEMESAEHLKNSVSSNNFFKFLVLVLKSRSRASTVIHSFPSQRFSEILLLFKEISTFPLDFDEDYHQLMRKNNFLFAISPEIFQNSYNSTVKKLNFVLNYSLLIKENIDLRKQLRNMNSQADKIDFSSINQSNLIESTRVRSMSTSLGVQTKQESDKPNILNLDEVDTEVSPSPCKEHEILEKENLTLKTLVIKQKEAYQEELEKMERMLEETRKAAQSNHVRVENDDIIGQNNDVIADKVDVATEPQEPVTMEAQKQMIHQEVSVIPALVSVSMITDSLDFKLKGTNTIPSLAANAAVQTTKVKGNLHNNSMVKSTPLEKKFVNNDYSMLSKEELLVKLTIAEQQLLTLEQAFQHELERYEMMLANED